MSNRRNRIAEAERRARRQLDAILDDVHERRLMTGARQEDLGSLLGWSRSWVGTVERNEVDDLGAIELARLCAAVGLDLSLRSFAGASVLRDAGQVGLINRLQERISPSIPWRLEALVAPNDQRAFDILLGHPPEAVAVEAITRLRDVQGQVRIIQAKVDASTGVRAHILLISATHANRRALAEAGAQLLRAYPLETRHVLSVLGRGKLPTQNGIVLL